MLGGEAGGWAGALAVAAELLGGSDDTDCACAAKAVPASNATPKTVDFSIFDISRNSSSPDQFGIMNLGMPYDTSK
jgi:hypothetical protein